MTSPDVAGVVVSHIVRPGREIAFEAWIERMSQAVRKAPGFLSIIRFVQEPAISHTLLQFESRDDLDRWLESPPFRALRAEGVRHSLRHIQPHVGSDGVFVIPSSSSAPKWKQAAATWIGVYPTLVTLQAVFVRPLAGTVNWLLLLTGSSVVMTVVLTWVILPRVRRTLRSWMFLAPGQDHDR